MRPNPPSRKAEPRPNLPRDLPGSPVFPMKLSVTAFAFRVKPRFHPMSQNMIQVIDTVYDQEGHRGKRTGGQGSGHVPKKGRKELEAIPPERAGGRHALLTRILPITAPACFMRVAPTCPQRSRMFKMKIIKWKDKEREQADPQNRPRAWRSRPA